MVGEPFVATQVTAPAGPAWNGTVKDRFWLGAKSAWPVVIGYLPIGFAFGVLAAEAGLAVAEISAMSILVYAGASQFIAVGMLAAGAGPAAVAATTFLVNLRHLLMSAALSPYFRGVRRPALAFLSFFVTDEAFGVGSSVFARRGEGDAAYFAGLGVVSYTAWVAASVAGAAVGSAVALPAALGLDFALTGMFIGLLASSLRDRPAVLAAAAGGLLAVATGDVLGRWSTMVAAVAAATAGVAAARWIQKFC